MAARVADGMGFFSRNKQQPVDEGDTVSGDVPPEAEDIVHQLEHMFPGAHIAVESKTITNPAEIQAALQAALGGAGVRAAPADRESARVEALERLAKLHEQGDLTDDEFAWEKKKILDLG
jgi:hypothetical protein